MKTNPKNKTLLYTNITIIFIIVLVLAGNFFFQSQELFDATTKNLYESLQSFKGITNNLITSYTRQIQNNSKLAKHISINPKNNATEDLIHYFDLLEKNNYVSNAYFIDHETGNGVSDTRIIPQEELKANSDLRNRFWYKEAQKNGLYISKAYTDLVSDKLGLTISYPVYSDQTFKGVIGYDILLNDVFENLKIIQYSKEADYYIIDHNNINIYSSDIDLIGKTSAFNKEFSATSSRFEHDDTIGYYSTIKNTGWKVLVLHNPKIYNHKISSLFLKNTLIGIFFIFLALVFTNYLYSKVLNIDRTTGFYNKNKFIQEIHRSQKNNVYVLFIDVNNMSTINNRFGYDFGDLLLSNLYSRLQKYFKNKGTVVHFTSDEFLVLIDSNSYKESRNLAFVLKEEYKDKVIELNHESIMLTLNISLIPMNLKNINNINNALILLKELLPKLHSKSNFLIFNSYSDIAFIKKENDAIKTQLINSMKMDQLVPFFQPIINTKNNSIEMYEVLMRIKDEADFIAPFKYIQIAEENNLIKELDLIMIEKTILYKLSNPSLSDVVFSINISNNTLTQESFYESVKVLIDKYPISAKTLIFEITETYAIDNFNKMRSNIVKLRTLGIRFSLDDFGTGFSNIESLKNLDIDFIKIDGSFIKKVSHDNQDKNIILAITLLANAFDTKIIAEYVENEAIINALKSFNINLMQGYYFEKPIQNLILDQSDKLK